MLAQDVGIDAQGDSGIGMAKTGSDHVDGYSRQQGSLLMMTRATPRWPHAPWLDLRLPWEHA